LAGHPSEDLLSTYALDEALVEDRAELEAHLDGCAPCQARLAALLEIERLFGNEDAWTDVGVVPMRPPGQRALSAIAARDRREDAEADALLTPILERFISGSSRRFMWDDIASAPEYHTAGVVRKLADAADKAQYSVPLRALILAETASVIVGMLSPRVYTSTEIAALRGVSWKQQANANRQLGRFPEALAALGRAERAYRELRRPELDLASITFIRATIAFEQQKYDVAKQLAEESTSVLAQLGQTELYLRSRYLQGCIAFEEGEVGHAQPIFEMVLAHGEANGDLSWIARASFELGNCHMKRGELARATQLFHQSLVMFRNLEMVVEEIRCRWCLALIVQRGGRYDAAVPRLQDVRDEFSKLGVICDAALVTLDIMETFLLLGKPREIRRSAGNIVKLFKEAGMVTGALTAAGYLKQAAALHGVTPTVIDYIRRYIRRVALQPDLAFVPPSAL
jgi:tetratricopeptide (TPR) repeat protein